MEGCSTPGRIHEAILLANSAVSPKPLIPAMMEGCLTDAEAIWTISRWILGLWACRVRSEGCIWEEMAFPPNSGQP